MGCFGHEIDKTMISGKRFYEKVRHSVSCRDPHQGVTVRIVISQNMTCAKTLLRVDAGQFSRFS